MRSVLHSATYIIEIFFVLSYTTLGLFLFTKSDFLARYDVNNFNHSGESEGKEESLYFYRIIFISGENIL